jgi:hypothetical protein
MGNELPGFAGLLTAAMAGYGVVFGIISEVGETSCSENTYLLAFV